MKIQNTWLYLQLVVNTSVKQQGKQDRANTRTDVCCTCAGTCRLHPTVTHGLAHIAVSDTVCAANCCVCIRLGGTSDCGARELGVDTELYRRKHMRSLVNVT